jgi:hypothetical protein
MYKENNCVKNRSIGFEIKIKTKIIFVSDKQYVIIKLIICRFSLQFRSLGAKKNYVFDRDDFFLSSNPLSWAVLLFIVGTQRG